MNRPLRFLRFPLACCAAAAVALLSYGCAAEKPKPRPLQYQKFDKRPVPPFMQGTIYENTFLQNDSPFLVSGWGLVVNLNGTGGSEQAPNVVKAFMRKQLEVKGFGSTLSRTYAKITPETVLQDKNASIVQVFGWLPPGARKGQFFDIGVSAEAKEVTSLARGMLYETPLTLDGANPVRPALPVNVWAAAYGPVFINPAAVIKFTPNPDPVTKRSLRTGTIIGGGQVISDRPLLIRLRQPENRVARLIETRVNEYFHRDKVCTAYDMGYCQLWVPLEYQGDWEHFSKLVMHLYFQGGSEAFGRAKARELVAEARKPGAPLQDISYCWEGLGTYAMPELAPLLSDTTVPTEVRFAAARAAAYIGDPSGAAERALYDIALAGDSAFQLPAVQVLGRVPNSRAVNQLLRDLLDSEKTTVRVEAYKILARNNDPAIETHVITSNRDSNDQKFALDFVHSHGDPLIYATRSGVPRIALFGEVPQVTLPLTFAAMDNRLMISSGTVGRDVTLFYRDAQLLHPVQMTSPPDMADILARLAGQIDDGDGHFDFTYAEVLGILQSLSDERKLRVTKPTGEEMAAAFMMQAPPAVNDAIDNAPLLDRGRPQGGEAAPSIEAPPADLTAPKPIAPATQPAATAMREQ